MPTYANLGGRSGVIAYKIGPDSIEVLFDDGKAYLYTGRSAGVRSLETMKALAEQGFGLNSFINRVVKKNYASRRFAGATL